MVTVAFYKAKGTLYDYIVRWVTKSQYSHCEFIEFIGDDDDKKCIGYTSSPRDRGVVIREINFKPDHWDLMEVDWISDGTVFTFVREHLGEPYDWVSIFLTHFFRFGLHRDGHWICSELLADALGVSRPWEISPGDLYRIIQERNAENLVPLDDTKLISAFG